MNEPHSLTVINSEKALNCSILTYMIASGPLMPGTVNPITNLSWDTRMWMAAAVVKPDTRVSDRYMTTKPICRTPIASWKRQSGHYDNVVVYEIHFNFPPCTERSDVRVCNRTPRLELEIQTHIHYRCREECTRQRDTRVVSICKKASRRTSQNVKAGQIK